MDTKYVDSRIVDVKKIAQLVIDSVPNDTDHEGYPAIANGKVCKDWKNHPDKLRMKRTMDKEARKLKKLKGEVRYHGKYTSEKEKRAIESKRLIDTLIEKLGPETFKERDYSELISREARRVIGLMKDSFTNRSVSYYSMSLDFVEVIHEAGGVFVFPPHLTRMNKHDSNHYNSIKNCLRIVIGDKSFGFR